jgi:hypothetical protein
MSRFKRWPIVLHAAVTSTVGCRMDARKILPGHLALSAAARPAIDTRPVGSGSCLSRAVGPPDALGAWPT